MLTNTWSQQAMSPCGMMGRNPKYRARTDVHVTVMKRSSSQRLDKATAYANQVSLAEWRPRLRWELQKKPPRATAPRAAVPPPLPSPSRALLIMTRRGASPLCRQPSQDKHPLQLDRETALWTRRICIIQLTERKRGWQSLRSIVSTLVGNPLVCKLTQWTIMAPSKLVQYRVSAAAVHAR